MRIRSSNGPEERQLSGASYPAWTLNFVFAQMFSFELQNKDFLSKMLRLSVG